MPKIKDHAQIRFVPKILRTVIIDLETVNSNI